MRKTIEKILNREAGQQAAAHRNLLPAHPLTRSPSHLLQQGFTLLEVLVASLLMGMLVTILTMIFNQSSIAWRTGRASVSDLAKITQQQSVYQYVADHAIPFLGSGKRYCVVSPWKDADNSSSAKGVIRDRSIATVEALRSEGRIPYVPGFSFANVSVDGLSSELGDGRDNSGDAYVVGVRSSGPDRFFGDKGEKYAEDDITTWPDEVE